jgi:FAR1 DNA-binding domain
MTLIVGLKIFQPYIITLYRPEKRKKKEEKEEDEEEEWGVGGHEESERSRLQPCVGMEFKTAGEAYGFYNAYACHIGFSIWKATQSKSRNGVLSVRFVCSKNGLSQRKRDEQRKLIGPSNVRTPEREHKIRRTSCKTSLRIRLTREGVW